MKTKVTLIALLAMPILVMIVVLYPSHKISVQNKIHENQVVQVVEQAGFSHVRITNHDACTVVSKRARSKGEMYTVLARDSQGGLKELDVFRSTLTGDTRIMPILPAGLEKL